MNITIYTDGSYFQQYNIGAWAAIIFTNDERTVIQGIERDSTHNRMELTAIIKAVTYAIDNAVGFKSMTVVTDSQYAVNLPGRKDKLITSDLKTKKGTELRNADLVRVLFELMSKHDLKFEKIKAHQKASDTINYNREVDKLVRALLRAEIAFKSAN